MACLDAPDPPSNSQPFDPTFTPCLLVSHIPYLPRRSIRLLSLVDPSYISWITPHKGGRVRPPPPG